MTDAPAPSASHDDGSAGVAQDGQGDVAAVAGRHDDAGFEGQFQAVAGGRLRCLTCDEQFAADQVGEFRETRMEGASDPGDMALVVSLACVACGAQGTLIARYGPEASEEEADVLQALERR